MIRSVVPNFCALSLDFIDLLKSSELHVYVIECTVDQTVIEINQTRQWPFFYILLKNK